MKVSELIEKLKEMPQNAEVFVYSYLDEGDMEVDEVKRCRLSPDWPANSMYPYMEEYGCQADSIAATYLKEHPNETEVVVIGSF